MKSFTNTFLFGIYPYIALISFILGSAIRYDREQYTWKASSSQMLDNTLSFRIGNNLFHVGIILILLGHFFGLLTPSSIYHQFISIETKQFAAMTAGGIFGIVCFVGMTILVIRRLSNSKVRMNSNWSDTLILLLLYFQLILGLLTLPISYQNPNGESMVALANWAQHIITFQSDAVNYITNEHIIFKFHVVSGLTLLLLFPFTRLVHIISFPVQYLTRSGYQIVRSRFTSDYHVNKN